MTTLIDRITTAIARNNLAALRKLVTRENANLEDEDGFTLVMNVILDEDAGPEMLKLLIERGADVHVAEREERLTALHLAARALRRDMVEILLAAGAAVDPLDSSGTTPLCLCVQRLEPDLAIVKLLLAHGADPKKRNRDGDSPLIVARFAEEAELLALLKGSATKRKSSGLKTKKKPAAKTKTAAKPARQATRSKLTPRKKG